MDPRRINEIRWTAPERVRQAVRSRRRPDFPTGTLLVIACDHPARGALAVGGRPYAMADRWDLLARIQTALSRPGVHGFLGTSDLVEDLSLMGALNDRLVFGSMNRSGLAGAGFEMDDRLTGYSVAGVSEAGLDGGKVLLRIDPDDPGSNATLERCAQVVSALAARDLVAMVEPFISHRVDGRSRNDLTTEAVVRSIAIASGLGTDTSRTWLKVPVAADMRRVAQATTMPLLILGGESTPGNEERWAEALRQPTVRGLVIGRSLLYPPDDDVAGAVDRVVALTRAGRQA
ncbi:MAG: hypothetical protein Q4G45_12995 [Actinomycetia bacterium]|nr:hypothetical protein [Actinomycetes bacterium]